MVTKTPSKPKPFVPTPLPNPKAKAEQIILSQLADRTFAHNRNVFNASIEALVSKLLVERGAYIEGFGTFTVGHVPKKYRYLSEDFDVVVAFTPDSKLIKELEESYAKF